MFWLGLLVGFTGAIIGVFLYLMWLTTAVRNPQKERQK